MTESLSRLLLRLSDAGPAVLSGRTLAPWPGRAIEALLGRRVMVEMEPLTEWTPCSDCDQGCESRAILSHGGGLIAACPHDSRRDEALTADDVRAFAVDIANLCQAIRKDTGLGGGDIFRITDDAWALGTIDRPGQSPLAVVLVFDLQSRNVADLILLIRNRLRLDAVIVSLALPSPVLREQLLIAGMTIVTAVDALADNDVLRPFALDPHRLTRPAGGAPARLVIRMAERTVTFDGHLVHLAPQPFALLALLAQHAIGDRKRVQRRDIEDALFGRAVHGHDVSDIVRRLRASLTPFVGGRDGAHALVENKRPLGFRLALEPHEIDLV